MKLAPLITLFTSTRIICSMLFCVLFHTLGEAAGKPKGFHFNGDHKTTQFSFQLIENLIIVPVKVNNKRTLKFILDTGSKAPMILNPSLAKSLDLTYGKTVAFTGRGLKKIVKGKMAHNVSLEMPGVVATGMSLVVLNEDYLKTKDFPIKVHGILGYGLFARFVVDIDYEMLLIRLYSPQVYKPGILFNTLDIELHDTKPITKALLTTSEAEKVEVNLLLDTGAGTGVVLDSYSNAGIITPSRKKERYIGRGLGGHMMGKVGKVYRMQLGQLTIQELHVAIISNKLHFGRQSKLRRHGSIGGQIFSHLKQVVFNYAGRKVYVRKDIALSMNYAPSF